MAARRRLSAADMLKRQDESTPEAITSEVENTVKQALDPDKSTSAKKPEKPKLPARRRTTVYIRDDYYRQAETATRYLKDRGLTPKSISAFIDDALGRELARLAKAHNDGEPWPKPGE